MTTRSVLAIVVFTALAAILVAMLTAVPFSATDSARARIAGFSSPNHDQHDPAVLRSAASWSRSRTSANPQAKPSARAIQSTTAIGENLRDELALTRWLIPDHDPPARRSMTAIADPVPELERQQASSVTVTNGMTSDVSFLSDGLPIVTIRPPSKIDASVIHQHHDRLAKMTILKHRRVEAVLVTSAEAKVEKPMSGDGKVQASFTTHRSSTVNSLHASHDLLGPDRQPSAKLVGENNSAEAPVQLPIVERNHAEDTSRLDNQDKVRQPPVVAKVDTDRERGPWPQPTALIVQLKGLSRVDAVQAWANDALRNLDELRQTERLDEPVCSKILDRLAQVASRAESLSATLVDPEQQVDVRTAGHAITRRVQLWRVVHANVREDTPNMELLRTKLVNDIGQLEASLRHEEHGESWRRFFMLLDLNHHLAADGEDQQLRELAQRLLERIKSQPLNVEQQSFLASPPTNRFVDDLRWLAGESIDYVGLLGLIEDFEERRGSDETMKLADAWNTLQWRTGVQGISAARKLSTYYRNANLRMEVSDSLLNRLLPDVNAKREPVNDTIAGVRVRGTSAIRTKLALRLLPDLDRWRFVLEANGTVASRTASRQGILRFVNGDRSIYTATKQLALSRDGVHTGQTMAEVQSRPRLRRVSSDLDLFPPVGFLVREFARPRAEQRQRSARREVQGRVAQRVRQRIDAEVDQRLEQAHERLQNRVVDRLARLELEPVVIQLETQPSGAVARWRLASSRQLASHTPRPRPIPGSLANVQLHQTAVNNVLQQLSLGDRSWTLPELYQELLDKLELREVNPPGELPADMTVELKGDDAIRFEIYDGRAVAKLRIRYLTRGRRIWRNLTVEADYAPVVEGLRVELVRTGGVRLRGTKLGIRDQIALRSIFTKFFTPNRRLPLTLPNLDDDPRLESSSVTQCVLRDGWIGISISEAGIVENALAKKDG